MPIDAVDAQLALAHAAYRVKFNRPSVNPADAVAEWVGSPGDDNSLAFLYHHYVLAHPQERIDIKDTSALEAFVSRLRN